MKKLFIALVASLLSFSLFALEGKIQYDSFEKAKKSGDNQLKFIVTSTKVGLFSSDVDGYVKNYSYRADYDEKNHILRNMVITIQTAAMDTDGEGRDEKLHNLCLSHKDYPTIEVKLLGSLYLESKRPSMMKGEVLIRGKKKPFSMEVENGFDDKGFFVKGKTTWSLKGMEIPDPSIAVAKLSDDIRIHFSFRHEK